MTPICLSELARRDLFEIADFTLDNWGREQAERYLDGLEASIRRIAEMPRIGRACNQIRRGYRRLEHESHVIFYRIEEDHIFVSRILHKNMLPARHFMDELEAE